MSDLDIDSLERLVMPSLDSLEKSLRGKRMLGKLLGVHGPPTQRGMQIADGYVQLVEKTVLEYIDARDKLIAFVRDGYDDDYHRAQDHFESCINSLHRAILYLERLRRKGFRQLDGTPFIPRPRDLEVIRQDVQKQVRVLRDACEHLDDDIINGTFPLNAEVAIHLGWEQAQLGEARIRYDELSAWITQLHHFAVLLSRVEIVIGDASYEMG